MNKPLSFNLEQEIKHEFDLVFGIDEVGRGSFAGPLVACAVYFKNTYSWFRDINDSKLLTKNKREVMAKLILKNATCFTEVIEVDYINKYGIGKANLQVFENLIIKISNSFKNQKIKFLIDGNKQNISTNSDTDFIVKGDSKVISIAAASIVAKVFRDKTMTDLNTKYSNYNFNQNKGYGTKAHRDAISIYGLSDLHRTSFDLNKFVTSI